MEICLDCKDKVVKFYHFKRRAREVQSQNLGQFSSIENLQPGPKHSKVVHNIVKIVEKYSEECSISSIRVDKHNKKLIIESAAVSENLNDASCSKSCSPSRKPSNESFDIPIKEEPIDNYGDAMAGVEIVESSTDTFDFANTVIKEEPELKQIIYTSQIKNSVPKTPSARASRCRYNRPTISTDDESSQVSKAALKMRAYRARLKKPENKMRYLLHLEHQRQWNRRHYIKKQIDTGKPIRSRRRRTKMPDIGFIEQSDSELFFNSQ